MDTHLLDILEAWCPVRQRQKEYSSILSHAEALRLPPPIIVMGFSPPMYPVVAAVVTVSFLANQASGESLDFAPFTIADSAQSMGPTFPGIGKEVSPEACAYKAVVDPLLPDISTILPVPVIVPELLANQTLELTIPVHDKVGTSLLSEATPYVTANHFANLFMEPQGGLQPEEVATGEEKPTMATRKLRDVASHDFDNSLGTKRRLESFPNQDIAKLENHFNVTIERNLTKLPTVGLLPNPPWPGPYWATHLDVINVRLNQSSAAEKYAMAFGLNVKNFMDQVSADAGIDSVRNRPSCRLNSECVKDSHCSMRNGTTSGICIPKWFGLCHAWAVAAILENEPRCRFVYNGVLFRPIDVKAITTMMYDGASVPTVFLGTRFRDANTNAVDRHGRPVNPALRDLNPGFFHIAVTNIVGILQQSFVIDREASGQVWNHPVRGYEVLEEVAMSPQEAARYFYALNEYPWNARAASIVFIHLRLLWIRSANVDGGLVSSNRINEFTAAQNLYYLLELDPHKLIIGGEWLSVSQKIHPDFMWIGTKKPDPNFTTRVGIQVSNVNLLLKLSTDC